MTPEQQLLTVCAVTRRVADAAAEAIVGALCQAMGVPRRGPWAPQLEVLLTAIAARPPVAGPTRVAAPSIAMLKPGVDPVCAWLLDRLGLPGRRWTQSPAASTPRPVCARCHHRHLDRTGQMGCFWCPCGHPARCGCAGCETELRPARAALLGVLVARASDLVVVEGPTVQARRWRDPRAGSRVAASRRTLGLQLAVGRLVFPDQHRRPAHRSDCAEFERPCPFVSCRHHLALDVTPAGSIVETRPELEVWDLPQTCSLDVADQGGATLLEVGQLLGVTRERVRQIEAGALAKLRRRAPALAAYLEGTDA